MPETECHSFETDSEGNRLFDAQAEYFKNSKVRDHPGRLKKMYHGTSSFGFTVFDPEFGDDGLSLFFTDCLSA